VRLVLRILGTDVVELSTDPAEPVEAAPDQRGVSGAADLTPAGYTFGFAPHDEPLVEDV
jgi:hypothetical protein